MSTNNDERIKYLIDCVKSGDHDKFEELKKIYGRHIDETIKHYRQYMNNNDYQDLVCEAHSVLFLAITRYNEAKHKNAFYYLANFVKDEVRLMARRDKDSGFPRIPIFQSIENEDGKESLDPVENSQGESPTPTSEDRVSQLDIQERLAEFRESLKKQGQKKKKAINILKVYDDIIHNPDDHSIRSIERRTGIPKSTVSNCKQNVIKELAKIFRTDYSWLSPLITGAN